MWSTPRLGPLTVGQALPGGRVTALGCAPGRARVEVALGDRAIVEFDLAAAPARPGPFAALPALSYRRSAASFAAVRAVGDALAAALAPAWPGVTAVAWPDVIDGLGDDVDATVRLADLLPAEALARRACVAPWTRLEYGARGQRGPCCADFQVAPADEVGAPLALWHGPAMRGFRRALASPDPGATCRATCPRLVGRTDTLAAMVARGGPAAFRANQIATIAAILDGAERPATTPLEVVFPATSFCNYDCLMCSHGATGTLADERPPAFYAALAAIAPGLGRLEALGGEPLASPVFRAVLGGDAFAAAPQVEFALTTNGSYLTPDELARYRRVRLGHVTVSLNAATAATYQAVNRGLAWARVRPNLDALLAAHRAARNPRAITYSMVILRANLHEIEAFAALAEADDVAVRYMLPMQDRNRQSILTDAATMDAAQAALAAVAARLRARGRAHEAARADGERAVLASRRARGLLRALPD
ncbi:MAG: radical SAM protein [Myxococcales bacterium]|nr:radical SAM protein [Myxococcales bacterium]